MPRLQLLAAFVPSPHARVTHPGMKKVRFSGDEDRACIAIVAEMGRVKWRDVVEKLKEAGFPERTAKSVRNRHLRWRVYQEAERTGALVGQNINRCRVCAQYMRGHVCSGGVVEGADTEACVTAKDPD